MKSLNIEQLKPSWIPEVAEIHMQSLPDDFLPGLGYDFLKNTFYPAACNSPYGKIFISAENDHPNGFAIVTKDSGGFFRSIVQDQFWEFFKIGLRTSLSSCKQLKNNIEILFSSLKKNVDENYGEIYEIAVRKEDQGKGIGKKLVLESIEYLKHEGIPGIRIKTLKQNTEWVHFFLKSGWHQSREIKLINNEYVVLSMEL